MSTTTAKRKERDKAMAADNGERFTCYFVLERETKGALRYQQVDKSGDPIAVGDGAELGSVYIRKTAFKGDVPQKITIVVSK